MSEQQAAQTMRERAAALVESGFDSGSIDWSWRAVVNRSALKHIAGVIRAIPLPDPSPDPREATIARLSADLEAAREALEPFAECAGRFDDPIATITDSLTIEVASRLGLTVGHLRRARRARAVLAKLSKGA